MSFNLDDANVGGQIKVGTGIFPAIGEGVTRVNDLQVLRDLLSLGIQLHFLFHMELKCWSTNK